MPPSKFITFDLGNRPRNRFQGNLLVGQHRGTQSGEVSENNAGHGHCLISPLLKRFRQIDCCPAGLPLFFERGHPPCSSGGLICRNPNSSARSYTVFKVPLITNGSPEKPVPSKAPLSAGPTDKARLRGAAVIPAATGRSAGVTTAITYEVRVGTSICESAARMSRNASTTGRLGTNAAIIRHRFDGICVNTMVFTRPTRFAIRAATRYENALRMLVQK